MTIEDFDNIIKAHPALTTHGFGIDEGSSTSFEEERARLSDCYKEALVCVKFLSLCKRRVTPNTSLGSSYALKHAVERYTKLNGSRIYIPEGALIAAALHLEFTMKAKEATTSVYLNISNKTKIDGTWIQCF